MLVYPEQRVARIAPDDSFRSIYDSLVLSGAKRWSDCALPVSMHSVHTQIARKVNLNSFLLLLLYLFVCSRCATMRST